MVCDDALHSLDHWNHAADKELCGASKQRLWRSGQILLSLLVHLLEPLELVQGYPVIELFLACCRGVILRSGLEVLRNVGPPQAPKFFKCKADLIFFLLYIAATPLLACSSL